MVNMANTVAALSKCNLAFRVSLSEEAIRVTEVIIMGRAKIVDFRVLDLLIMESTLLGEGVAISRTSSGLRVVVVEGEARMISRKLDTLKVPHVNNSRHHLYSPIHCPTKMIIRSDLLKTCKSKTRVPGITEYPQTVRRCPLPRGSLREVHQRKTVPNSALPSRPKPHLQ